MTENTKQQMEKIRRQIESQQEYLNHLNDKLNNLSRQNEQENVMIEQELKRHLLQE